MEGIPVQKVVQEDLILENRIYAVLTQSTGGYGSSDQTVVLEARYGP